MPHDVIVVGAGPVGSTLALCLAGSDLDVVVLDARAPGESLRGDRSLALSHGSRLILESLGAWGALSSVTGAVTPILRIDVSQAGGFGDVTLDADEHGLPALGYVVRYRALQAALDAVLARSGVAVRHGTEARSVGAAPDCAKVSIGGESGEVLEARLAAIADGSGTAIGGIARKRRDYGQMALVAGVWTEAPHGGLAYERFTAEGPIALLPEGGRYGLVWTAKPGDAQSLLERDDGAFLDELARRFGTRAGRFTRVADRRAFPLSLEFAAEPASARSIVLGNAAQTLHPVAGQGFNMGLRDARELGEIVRDTPRASLGDRSMVDRYVRARRVDRAAGIAFTHGLVTLFGNDNAIASWPRGLALTLLGAVPPAKRAFTRAMLFGMR
jgi:2-octaprenyl-6-methoxyphenol hydroxylase